jgi:hypothetical protein
MIRPPRRPPPGDAEEEEPAWPKAERRACKRRRITLPATFFLEWGPPVATEVVDISAGGIRLAAGGGAVTAGARGAIAVEGLIGPLSCTVVGAEGGTLRLRFDALEALRARLLERLDSLSWDPRAG